MTNLETIHRQILKEQKRIEMLKNAKSNGEPEWYDFVNDEVKDSKIRISELQKQLDLEYTNK